MLTPFPQMSSRLNFAATLPSDVPQLVELYNSNPFFLEATEGKSVVTETEVLRDLEETASFASGSWSLSIREKGNTEVIGVAQFILENPRDGNPWLGLLMFHRQKQRFGYAREFLDVLVGWYQENGYTSLHLGVQERNDLVIPFYEKCGFHVYEVRDHPKLGRVICMARHF